jgi:hypothetical protein
MVVFEWQAVGFSEEGHWPSRWLFDPATDYDPRDCQYLGPCLTLAEVAAREAAAFKRGAEAMREAAARLLQYHAARLRKDDEDNRGIPAGMGHSFEANAGDAWAAAIAPIEREVGR